MAKIFEDYFSEAQADMVSVCMEYVEEIADKIFICCSFEEDSVQCYFFYQIQGKILEQHKLNDVSGETGHTWDVSEERQLAVLDALTEDMEKLMEVCKNFSQEMPSLIKLVYDVKANSLNADYKYGDVYAGTKKGSDDIAEEWFNEIKKGGAA